MVKILLEWSQARVMEREENWYRRRNPQEWKPYVIECLDWLGSYYRLLSLADVKRTKATTTRARAKFMPTLLVKCSHPLYYDLRLV